MRKLSLVIVFSLFLFGLAGCDLLNNIDQDDIIDTVCEDNPDAEGCQEDIQDTIELASVESLFNTIMAEAHNTSVADICELHFSESGQTECTEAASLMPPSLGDYRLLSIIENVSPMTYDITVESLDGLTEVVFTVTFSQVDASYVVDTWSYVITQESPNNNNDDEDNNNGGDNEQLIDPIYVESLFTAFIEDYLNPNLTNQSVCETYFSGIDTTDCIDNRDMDLTNNFSAELIDIEIIAPGEYIFTFTVQNDFMETPETAIFPATYVSDPTPHIVLMIADDYIEPPSIDETIVLSIFESFINDYLNSTVSNNDICTVYFGIDDLSLCTDILERDPNNLTMAELTIIDTLHIGNDVYDITINYVEDSRNYTETITVYFYYLEDQLVFTPSTNTPPSDDIEAQLNVFESFIADYQSSTLTDNELFDIYFSGIPQYDAFMSLRQTFLDEDYVLMIDAVDFLGNEFYTTIWIKDQNNTVLFAFDMFVNVEINDDNVYINYYAEPYNEENPNFEMYASLVQEMQDMFNDSTMSTDAFCTTYFTDEGYFDCFTFREAMLLDDYILESSNFYVDDAMQYHLHMSLYSTSLDHVINVYYIVYFEHQNDDITMVFEEAEPNHMWVDYYAVSTYIDTMIEQIYSNLLVDDVCLDYGHILPDCTTFIASIRDTESMIELVEIRYIHGEIFNIELSVNPLDTPAYYFDMELEFYYDENAILMSRAVDISDFYTYIQDSDASPIINAFIEDYFDASVSEETMINTYYKGIPQDHYKNERTDFLSLGWTVSTIQLTSLSPTMIHANITMLNIDNQSFTFDMYLSVKDYLNDGFSVEYYSYIYPWEPHEPIDITPFITEMVSAFSDPTIDTMTYCEKYLPFDSNCEFIRNRILNNTILSVEYTSENNYNHYIIEMTITYADGSYEILHMDAYADPTTQEEPVIYIYDITIPLPDNATEITDYTIIENTMSTFITMVFDSTVDAQTLCDMWFGGVLLYPECIDGRELTIDEGVIMNVIQNTVIQTDNGFYQIDIEVYHPDGDVEHVGQITFILYDLGNNTYYLDIDYR